MGSGCHAAAISDPRYRAIRPLADAHRAHRSRDADTARLRTPPPACKRLADGARVPSRHGSFPRARVGIRRGRADPGHRRLWSHADRPERRSSRPRRTARSGRPRPGRRTAGGVSRGAYRGLQEHGQRRRTRCRSRHRDLHDGVHPREGRRADRRPAPGWQHGIDGARIVCRSRSVPPARHAAGAGRQPLGSDHDARYVARSRDRPTRDVRVPAAVRSPLGERDRAGAAARDGSDHRPELGRCRPDLARAPRPSPPAEPPAVQPRHPIDRSCRDRAARQGGGIRRRDRACCRRIHDARRHPRPRGLGGA
jgi:hypothetical protein